jgi:hypothetical protein
MKKLLVKQSSINGVGIFSDSTFAKNEKIAYIDGPKVVVRDFSNFTKKQYDDSYNWIGIGKYSWIDTKKSIFRFINHSCEPNAAIVRKKTVIAIRNIPANTEITMDYSLTEGGQDWHIKCFCKAKKCRRNLGPINSLPLKTFNSYLPNIPKNFQALYFYYKKRGSTRK